MIKTALLFVIYNSKFSFFIYVLGSMLFAHFSNKYPIIKNEIFRQ